MFSPALSSARGFSQLQFGGERQLRETVAWLRKAQRPDPLQLIGRLSADSSVASTFLMDLLADTATHCGLDGEAMLRLLDQHGITGQRIIKMQTMCTGDIEQFAGLLQALEAGLINQIDLKEAIDGQALLNPAALTRAVQRLRGAGDRFIGSSGASVH